MVGLIKSSYGMRIVSWVSLYSLYEFFSGVSRLVCGTHLSFQCAEAIFMVNAGLIASQWLYRARTFFFNPLINSEHEAGQAASPLFKSSAWPDRELNHSYQLWWSVLNQLYQLAD